MLYRTKEVTGEESVKDIHKIYSEGKAPVAYGILNNLWKTVERLDNAEINNDLDTLSGLIQHFKLILLSLVKWNQDRWYNDYEILKGDW